MSNEKIKEQTCKTIDSVGNTLKSSIGEIISSLAECLNTVCCDMFDKAIVKTKRKMECGEEVNDDNGTKQ
jgi:hypothetical protein